MSIRLNVISIHASVKEATRLTDVYKQAEKISIHASVKEATKVDKKCHSFRHFNPRLREGGDVKYVLSSWLDIYFNPRLREGGDGYWYILDEQDLISIHASVKEATATYCDTSAIMYISSLNNFFVHYF